MPRLAAKELADNAIDASGTCRAGLLEGKNGFYVEDDGPGFDFQEIRRRSSGLGLVAGLARQIGGSLAVERGEERGARCIVRFRDQAAARG